MARASNVKAVGILLLTVVIAGIWFFWSTPCTSPPFPNKWWMPGDGCWGNREDPIRGWRLWNEERCKACSDSEPCRDGSPLPDGSIPPVDVFWVPTTSCTSSNPRCTYEARNCQDPSIVEDTIPNINPHNTEWLNASDAGTNKVCDCVTACSDGIDNDHVGGIDFGGDEHCTDELDDSEHPVTP